MKTFNTGDRVKIKATCVCHAYLRVLKATVALHIPCSTSVVIILKNGDVDIIDAEYLVKLKPKQAIDVSEPLKIGTRIKMKENEFSVAAEVENEIGTIRGFVLSPRNKWFYYIFLDKDKIPEKHIRCVARHFTVLEN